MPSLGADMDAGTLLEWYVGPGDTVKRGDIVALVDTDKAAIEVEVFEDGVVGELLVPPGEKVPVGTPLAMILPAGAAAAAAPAATQGAELPAQEAAADTGTQPGTQPATQPATRAATVAAPVTAAPVPATAAPPKPAQPDAGRRPAATPAARNHARELGIDLGTLQGSGRHGVITSQDVDAAARATPGSGAGTAAGPGAHVRASPLARRLASEAGIELSGLPGSGPGGAVTQDDVRAAAGQPARAPSPTQVITPAPARPAEGAALASEDEDERSAAMRRAIAAAMSRSKREIPHYYLSLHVDMTRALAWLEETNLQRAVTERVLPAALVLKATALAARDVPDLNGFYLEDGFHPSQAVHLGVGISLRQGGLIAPAIHDADTKDLPALMAALRDLVKRTRNLQLRSSELTDATMTSTNLGDQGVESVFGIIYPPQVALVGFGRILERPWAENGMLAVRKQMHITLSADHRASDGHRGGLFLSAIERHLQHPEEL